MEGLLGAIMLLLARAMDSDDDAWAVTALRKKGGWEGLWGSKGVLVALITPVLPRTGVILLYVYPWPPLTGVTACAGSKDLEGLLGAIMPLLVRAVDSDDDARAVTAALGGLTNIVQLVGAEPCLPFLAEIVEAARKALAGEAICQITVDSDLEDLEEEQDDEVAST